MMGIAIIYVNIHLHYYSINVIFAFIFNSNKINKNNIYFVEFGKIQWNLQTY